VRRLLSFALLGSILIGCSSQASVDKGVPWGNYAPGVQSRIADEVTRKDCAALDNELIVSDANDVNQRRRVGEGNEKLQVFLADQIKLVGCDSASPPVAVAVTVPPTKLGGSGGVAYKVIETVHVMDGSLDLDLLFPSLNPGDPGVEGACVSAAEKEGAQHVYCYSTVSAREANMSEAYSKAHPGELDAGYLGSWSSSSGFEPPIG
jgi:hypothetical protein